MSENEISKIIFESGLKIHRKLGIGLMKWFNKSVCCLNLEIRV